ncbi:MAG: hypothetical protein CVU89_09830 [Firmicutes bacterium HGW-Firmicutes-14]|nr:MAG: hypothetical protein CVU89_09830 [Firmicutes bacterium HGW-Firmicutes-14]
MPEDFKFNPSSMILRCMRWDLDKTAIVNFRCGDKKMEEFLVEEAWEAHCSRDGSTTVLIDKEAPFNDNIMGFYTLIVPQVVKVEEQGTIDELSTVGIARIAVALRCQNQGVARYLIRDILFLAEKINQRLVSTYAAFEYKQLYERLGFKSIIRNEVENPEPNEPKVLMLTHLADIILGPGKTYIDD